MENEIWKSVKGYEGLYEVSSYGRVRSVDRITNYANGEKRLYKGRLMKISKKTKGYLGCDLCKNSKVKTITIHRLVAETFLPNPNNLPEVNHKDEDKTNNFIFLKKDGSVDLDKSNLEWCTSLYNANYGTRNKRSAEKRLNSPKLSKSVLQIDANTGRVISEYPSANEAARKLNIHSSGISKCCRGRYKTAYGFKWRYQD